MSPDAPVILVVDLRPGVAASRARVLQGEAGEALRVVAHDAIGETLDACRSRGVAAIVASHALAPECSGLDLLARVRSETPHVRRILVTSGDLDRAAREPEYVRVHAAFDVAGRFADVASGIVREALPSVGLRRQSLS